MKNISNFDNIYESNYSTEGTLHGKSVVDPNLPLYVVVRTMIPAVRALGS